MIWRTILFKLTACPLWRISETFEWLWGFFEQCGNWWEDLIWTEGGPSYDGFKYLFSLEYFFGLNSYRRFED